MNTAQRININFMALWAAGTDPLLAANDIAGRGNFWLTWWWDWGKTKLRRQTRVPRVPSASRQ